MQISEGRTRKPSALRDIANVYHALFLRDIRTRFFGSGIGYLIFIMWPVSHVLLLLLFWFFAGRTAPYGESSILFFMTGLIPFIVWSYPARFITFSMLNNRPLLYYPVVKFLDIVLARAILEVLGACVATMILLGLVAAVGVNPLPFDYVNAAFAFGASALLGVGFGVCNAMIAAVIPFWATWVVMFTVVMYMTSSIFFLPANVPQPFRDYLLYNPILHAIEWMRSAYYLDYGYEYLSKAYVIYFGLFLLFIGLVIERAIRVRLLQG